MIRSRLWVCERSRYVFETSYLHYEERVCMRSVVGEKTEAGCLQINTDSRTEARLLQKTVDGIKGRLEPPPLKAYLEKNGWKYDS